MIPVGINGPPYAVAESSFDEYDQQGCTPFPPPDAVKEETIAKMPGFGMAPEGH